MLNFNNKIVATIVYNQLMIYLFLNQILDEIQHDQKLNTGQANLDNVSTNSFSPPYLPATLRNNYNNSPGSTLNVQTLGNNDSSSRQHFIQQPLQQVVQGMAANPGSNLSTTGRVINRNYLQVQANNAKSNTLNSSQFSTSLYTDESLKSSNLEDSKRARSISRSLRSLFNRSTKNPSKKRDKSYDSPNLAYDVQSGFCTVFKIFNLIF